MEDPPGTIPSFVVKKDWLAGMAHCIDHNGRVMKTWSMAGSQLTPRPPGFQRAFENPTKEAMFSTGLGYSAATTRRCLEKRCLQHWETDFLLKARQQAKVNYHCETRTLFDAHGDGLNNVIGDQKEVLLHEDLPFHFVVYKFLRLKEQYPDKHLNLQWKLECWDLDKESSVPIVSKSGTLDSRGVSLLDCLADNESGGFQLKRGILTQNIYGWWFRESPDQLKLKMLDNQIENPLWGREPDVSKLEKPSGTYLDCSLELSIVDEAGTRYLAPEPTLIVNASFRLPEEATRHKRFCVQASRKWAESIKHRYTTEEISNDPYLEYSLDWCSHREPPLHEDTSSWGRF